VQQTLKLTWAQVAAWRAQRHFLVERAPARSALKVASRLCGLHAQVLSSSELSLWARVEGLKRGAVSRALWKDRTLVKTWAMRGTLHLLPSNELNLWHGALGTSQRYRKARGWKNWLGITLDELDRMTEAIGVALDGRMLTREELIDELKRVTGAVTLCEKLARDSWGTFLKPAAFRGYLCFGPSRGPRACFTRPESWLGVARPAIDSSSAVTMVVRRFLSTYSPATYHDVARWWGAASVATIKKWIASLGDEVAVEIGGQNAWMLAAHQPEIRDVRPRSVRLLPAFDQYVIGASRHAEHLLPAGLRSRVYRPQGWVSPVLLINGKMEGVWRHEIRGDRVEIAIDPFAKIPPAVRRLAEEEAERLAHFLECRLNLDWKLG
jgi:hypothetical protein